MKKTIAILSLTALCFTSCQKEYSFKDENINAAPPPNPADIPQPVWIKLTTVFLYSTDFKFDVSWSYGYFTSTTGGGFYSVGPITSTISGGQQGHTIVQLPSSSSVNGNIITITIHIQDQYVIWVPVPVMGLTNVYDDVIVTIKYNVVTKTQTITYSSHGQIR